MSAIEVRTLQDNPLTLTCYTELPRPEILRKIAKLYAQAFARPPWNEYLKCQKKKDYHRFGINEKERTVCDKCQTPLTLYHPLDETVSKITKELQKTKATLLLFEKDEKVRAASWAFECSVEDLKYNSDMKKKVAETIKGKFFYLSECMTDKAFQKQGIATSMTKVFMKKSEELGYKLMVRTMNGAMDHILDRLGFKPIVKEDSERTGRILYLL